MNLTEYHNCRNCIYRLECTDKKESGYCANYLFDEEVATCDDCDKKDVCVEYLHDKPVCDSWIPIETCNDCIHHETCNNFMENGKKCGKFEAIRYSLTHKGCFYFALLVANDTPDVNIDIAKLMEKNFFETFEHELKSNNLVIYCKDNFFGKIKKFFKLHCCKPKKSTYDIFCELAHDDKFYKYFDNSETIVNLVYVKFAEIISKMQQ